MQISSKQNQKPAETAAAAIVVCCLNVKHGLVLRARNVCKRSLGKSRAMTSSVCSFRHYVGTSDPGQCDLIEPRVEKGLE